MDYCSRIAESVDQLRQLESQQKQARQRDRIRDVRLLKEGAVRSQRQAGEQIGLALRQSQRLWQTYAQESLQALISPAYTPAFGKLSAHQIAQLQAWLRLDQAATADRPDPDSHPNLHPPTVGHPLYHWRTKPAL